MTSQRLQTPQKCSRTTSKITEREVYRFGGRRYRRNGELFRRRPPKRSANLPRAISGSISAESFSQRTARYCVAADSPAIMSGAVIAPGEKRGGVFCRCGGLTWSTATPLEPHPNPPRLKETLILKTKSAVRSFCDDLITRIGNHSDDDF
jgi:hypothetical protein